MPVRRKGPARLRPETRRSFFISAKTKGKNVSIGLPFLADKEVGLCEGRPRLRNSIQGRKIMSDKYLITCSGQAKGKGKKGYVSFSPGMEPKDWQNLQSEIVHRAEEGYLVWQLDLDSLSPISYADSSFIGSLVILNSEIGKLACDMEVIFRKGSRIGKIFALLQLDQIISVCHS